jgi:CBS domain containing-hemolysin-like protein
MRLDEAEHWLGTRWQGPATTVGGHIVAALGRLPVQGESLTIDRVNVTVTDMGSTAVQWIVAEPQPEREEILGNDSVDEETG